MLRTAPVRCTARELELDLRRIVEYGSKYSTARIAVRASKFNTNISRKYGLFIRKQNRKQESKKLKSYQNSAKPTFTFITFKRVTDCYAAIVLEINDAFAVEAHE